MSKTLKILLIISILVIFSFNISFATSEDVFTISESEAGSFNETVEESTSTFNSSGLNNSGITSVTQVSNYSEANLGLNNILNIFLIAIGILIILFAIAILIRLKQ